MNGKNKKLIFGQKETEPKEDMKFYDQSRPDPGVSDKMKTKDTGFKDVKFPNAEEENTTYEEFLASREYAHALSKLYILTNERNIGTGLSQKYHQLNNQATSLFLGIQRSELEHKEELENLCEKIVREHFNINERQLQFDIDLKTEAIKVNPQQQRQQEPPNVERDENLVDNINNLTKDRAKRRLINAMTQGHAVNDTYIFVNAADELENILGVGNVAEKYSIIMSTMLLGYWQLPEETLQAVSGQSGGEGAGAGKTRVDNTTNPPTIHAEGVLFPFLIHEAIKGVMDYFGMEKRPQNPENYEKVKKLEDTVDKEADDIRLGPEIWRKLIGRFPRDVVNDPDKRKLIYHMYVNIVNLKTEEFLVLMNEIMSESEMAKRLLGAMYYDLTVRQDEGMNRRDSEFRKLMGELMEFYVDDEDIDDFMSQLGLTSM